MLVSDNWRLLNDRGAFEGKIEMVRAYINREDILSLLRKLDRTDVTGKTA